MINLANLGLLSVAIITAAIGILGFTVYFNNKNSVTNTSFLLFSIITILYGIVNYAQYQSVGITALWILRCVIFLAVWHAFSFFKLFYVFPRDSVIFSTSYKYFLLPLVALTSLITLTPLVFKQIKELSPTGRILTIENGPAFILFSLIVMSFVVAGIGVIVRKTLLAQGEEKKPFKLVSWGAFITFALLVTFNFILPGLVGDSTYIALAPASFFPFVAFTFYAIYKHKLFNIKVAAASLIAFILTVYSFLNLAYAENSSQIVTSIAYFILVLISSIILIRSVLKEIKLREQLQTANEGQTNLIHIMNHQIKGYLSKSKNIFAELLTNDYGRIPKAAKPLITEGLNSLSSGVAFVQGVLNGSSAESGALVYNMRPLDFKELMLDVAQKLGTSAKTKNLSFSARIETGQYGIVGDMIQLKECLRNLIDNSINYTLKGGLSINLETKGRKLLLSIKDTGVGICAEDMAKLFTKGGRGKDSLKFNVNSTGYGLSFVKAVVDAHKGRVWAESKGEGKGATFFVELPLA